MMVALMRRRNRQFARPETHLKRPTGGLVAPVGVGHTVVMIFSFFVARNSILHAPAIVPAKRHFFARPN